MSVFKICYKLLISGKLAPTFIYLFCWQCVCTCDTIFIISLIFLSHYLFYIILVKLQLRLVTFLFVSVILICLVIYLKKIVLLKCLTLYCLVVLKALLFNLVSFDLV